MFKALSSETLVKKYDTIKLFGWNRFKLLSLFTKVKESGTVWFENLSSTGFNKETKNVDKLYCGNLVIDKIGFSGISLLCVLGRSYNLGRCEPIVLIKS